MDQSAGDITRLLIELKSGRREAESELFPIVYNELRRLAKNYLRQERRDHTLQATALVHEAYLRLVHQHQVDWQDRAHFFAFAATLMRRILVDHARSLNASKRAGGRQRVALESVILFSEEQSGDLLALDEALNRLTTWDARQSRIIELRFFSGLSIEETAEVLGLSVRTVKRDWSMARAWLHGELTKEP